MRPVVAINSPVLRCHQKSRSAILLMPAANAAKTLAAATVPSARSLADARDDIKIEAASSNRSAASPAGGRNLPTPERASLPSTQRNSYNRRGDKRRKPSAQRGEGSAPLP